jgi:siroheme synthase-like protein
LAELLGELRDRIRNEISDPDARRELLEELASPEWLDRLRTEGPEATRQAMERLVAQGAC